MTAFKLVNAFAGLVILRLCACDQPYVGIVIPSFKEHSSFIQRNMNSFVKMCTDCADLPILIVTSRPGETEHFINILKQQKKYLRDLQVSDISTLITLTEYNSSAPFSMPTQVLRSLDRREGWGKHLLQSAKKLYGCLYVTQKSHHCLAMDSESFLIQKSSLVSITKAYMARPTIITNSFYVARHGHCLPSDEKCNEQSGTRFEKADIPKATKFVLGEVCSRDSRYHREVFTSNYHWIWDRDVLNQFQDHLRSQGTTLSNLLMKPPTEIASNNRLFIEETIYHFISCYHHRHTKYVFRDIAEILGDALKTCDGRRVLALSGHLNFFEDIGKYLHQINIRCPAISGAYTTFLRNNHIPTFSAAESSDADSTESSVAFLSAAGTSICTSWCSQEIHDKFNA